MHSLELAIDAARTRGHARMVTPQSSRRHRHCWQCREPVAGAENRAGMAAGNRSNLDAFANPNSATSVSP